MSERGKKIEACFSCPHRILVNLPSEYKRISGTTRSYCNHYGRELSNITEKPDFCKIEKISITEKD